MLELTHLLVLLILALLGYALASGIRVKEAAQRAVEQRCREVNVQLLDGTIALRGLGLSRNSRGHLVMTRYFQFEFTATGDDRNRGWIRLAGGQIQEIDLAAHRFVE